MEQDVPFQLPLREKLMTLLTLTGVKPTSLCSGYKVYRLTSSSHVPPGCFNSILMRFLTTGQCDHAMSWWWRHFGGGAVFDVCLYRLCNGTMSGDWIKQSLPPTHWQCKNCLLAFTPGIALFGWLRWSSDVPTFVTTSPRHPFIHLLQFDQVSRQRHPDFNGSSHLLQLICRAPKAFPNQPRDMVSLECPGSSLRLLPRGKLLAREGFQEASQCGQCHPTEETNFGRSYLHSCSSGHKRGEKHGLTTTPSDVASLLWQIGIASASLHSHQSACHPPTPSFPHLWTTIYLNSSIRGGERPTPAFLSNMHRDKDSVAHVNSA